MILEMQVAKETENKQIEQYIKEKHSLEKETDKLKKQYQKIEREFQELQIEDEEIETKLTEIKLIEEFNKKNKIKYCSYSSTIEMYCKSYLNELNQELFQLALKLNEAYIIKNGKEIVENLRLFLPEEQPAYICQKFYDLTDIYNDKKQEGIRNLWNTLFLCFPVITTTLDSFCKRCFHLISEYIDLELIDEAGQILPHNLVSALYRAKKAVIVGDVNQIEPIYSNIALDVRGKRTEKENQKGNKNENKVEAEACIQTIKYIKEQDKNESSIAIVTPYKEQKHLIESKSFFLIGYYKIF